MSETQALSKDQISTEIARKAFTDETFRKRVLANANEVYEQETGQKLPPGVTIKVYEDTASTVNFAIPAKPANAGELSDSELEAVAGGTSPALAFGVMAVTSIALSAIQGTQMNISKHKAW